MKPRTLIVVAAAGLAAIGAAAVGAVYLARMVARHRPLSPVAWVPESWRTFRKSIGHLDHVGGSKQVACGDCHDFMRVGFETPDTLPCARCHDVDDTVHVSDAGRATNDCLSCHPFRLDEDKGPWRCLRCHQEPQGAVRAVTLHTETCGDCHHQHQQPSHVPRPCGDCHGGVETRHGRRGDAPPQACLGCHTMHGAGSATATCKSCHASGRGAIPASATFGGHECRTCHPPHDFSKGGVRACGACHGERPLAAERARSHRACDACHDPHDVRGVAMSCETCHDRMQLGHPGDAAGRPCLGCHPAHPAPAPAAAASAAAPCSSCHTQATSDVAFHAGGVACSQCHRPHRFQLASGAPTCRACHTGETQRASRSKAGGHARCQSCHGGTHRPSAPPACAQCHAAEAGTIALGHADCAKCHDVHAGEVRAGTTCLSCHADRATGHGRPAVGCAKCHRPHGPNGPAQPPTCVSCHARARLPHLHAVAEHANCGACHQAHETVPRGDRPTCLACHTKQRDHEPAATSCVGCHPFGPIAPRPGP